MGQAGFLEHDDTVQGNPPVRPRSLAGIAGVSCAVTCGPFRNSNLPAGNNRHVHRSRSLVGSWRLVSVEATFLDTGERVATFGSAPNGRMVLTPAGRIMFLITKSDRHPPADDAARAALFNETIAYSGQVRVVVRDSL